MENEFSTSLCEAEFKRIGLKFWIGEDIEPVRYDIHTAASVGDVEFISELPSKQYDQFNKSKWTPLMYSCYLGHRHLLHFLLNQACDILKYNSEGRTPLILACMCGNLELAKDIFAFRKEARKAVDFADSRNFSALTHAVSGGHINLAQFLLDQGASPNLTEHEKGYSILMMCASSGNLDIAEILLEYKADISYENALGETALTVAQSKGHNSIVRLIRKHHSSKSNLSTLDGPARAKLLMEQQNKSINLYGNSLFSKVSDLVLEQNRIDRDSDVSTEAFLGNLGLEKYVDLFREQEVDFELLLTLTDNDLKQIGVSLLGPRRKITSAIERWKKDKGKIIS